MAPSSREEILRRYLQCENDINRAGAQLYEILTVFKQAETVFGTKYKLQRELINEILVLLKTILTGIEELRGL